MHYGPREYWLNNQQNKYDIWGFQFSCIHECHEYKWERCLHCRSSHKCNEHFRPVYPSEEGVYYPIEKIEISPQHAQDLGTYVHEFTEVSIIRVFRRMHIDWLKDVHFKDYERTYVTHFISLWGANNNTCLEPSTKRNKPRW
jgi:hypothetical protein